MKAVLRSLKGQISGPTIEKLNKFLAEKLNSVATRRKNKTELQQRG